MYGSDEWGPGRMMDGYRGDGMMDGGGWFMVVLGLLLVVLIVAVVLLAVRSGGAGSRGAASAPPSTSRARDELDLRLARGEVSPEEYGTLRTLLSP